LACCLDCADLVKHLRPTKSAEKIAAAVEVLRGWLAGTATIEQAKQARNDLYAADAYAAAAAAAAAAYAAAAADAAAADDAAAAAAAAYAAAAAAAAAAAYEAAAAYAARKAMLKECADVVRQHFHSPPTMTA
jgi:hypothetical protein